MRREKQIEEMAKVIDEYTEPLSARDINKADFSEKFAEHFYTAGYRKQIAGEWVVISKRGLNSERNRRINYETYTCAVCGRSNGKHKANFCPNCGAMMKGESKDV